MNTNIWIVLIVLAAVLGCMVGYVIGQLDNADEGRESKKGFEKK